MKASIYDQAVLEGVATSFRQTEEIIENGLVSGVAATDVQKVLIGHYGGTSPEELRTLMRKRCWSRF
ncbi:MAG: hypothetical protein IJ087_15000 [Eggerthellaceae bacterium]|nr:hypothetical protein [Eggerthellaceae bacterium]